MRGRAIWAEARVYVSVDLTQDLIAAYFCLSAA